MRYLSDSEAAKSCLTTEIAQTLPESVQEYCVYANNIKRKSVGGLYAEICNLRRFYNVMAEDLSKSPEDINIEDIDSISDDLLEKYLSIPFQPKFDGAKPRTVSETERSRRINALYNYGEFLVSEGLLSHNIITKPESKRNKGRVIKKPEDVKFTGTARIKTTIDGKYSLIKEQNLNSGESKFLYHIRDEVKGSYFTDDNGEILSIISYMEARKFVKNLYTKAKKNR